MTPKELSTLRMIHRDMLRLMSSVNEGQKDKDPITVSPAPWISIAAANGWAQTINALLERP